MAVKIKQSKAIGALSITPLIDVVFLLLIFFLVATRFEQEERQTDFPLPDASSATPLTVTPKQMFIDIDEFGFYFVGNRKMAIDEVERILIRAVRNNPLNQSVIIRAHKDVKLQHAVSAINACKKAKIAEYIMAIEAPGG